MKTPSIRFVGTITFLLSMLANSSALAQKEDFGSFYAGPGKSQMRLTQMKSQWSIGQALAAIWPFRRENSVCVMIRSGRVFLLGDAASIAGIDDFPVKPGDSFHRYAETDVKAWNLPVVQEDDAIRILKAEAEKERNTQWGHSPTTTDAVRIDTGRHEILDGVNAPAAPAVLAPNLTERSPQGTSTPWSVVAIVIVATGGLLWLLLKRRSQEGVSRKGSGGR